MLCHRCRGLLVYERFSDLREEAGGMSPAARCINCGYIEDSVVRFNRLHPPAAKRPIPRRTVRNVILLRPQSGRYRSVWAEGPTAVVPHRLMPSGSSWRALPPSIWSCASNSWVLGCPHSLKTRGSLPN